MHVAIAYYLNLIYWHVIFSQIIVFGTNYFKVFRKVVSMHEQLSLWTELKI